MPRAFTAIDIPQDIAEKLAKTQEKIGVGKAVEPEKMHITLEFFQGIEENKIKEIEKELDKIDFQPFSIEIKGLGVFPSKEHIRVIWAGVKSEEINQIYQKTSNVTPESDNSHDFHPHVTLSRVKGLRRGDKKRVHRGIERLSDKVFGKFKVSELKLYESKLGNNGSIYNELYKKQLSEEKIDGT